MRWHKGSNIKDMINVYLGLLPKQRYILNIVVFLFSIISVASQPIHLPAERFKCGPDGLNLSCERWGYDACITDGGESYCLPCYEEYMASLCGTPDEISGCNLYCAKIAVDKEIGRAKENFTEQLQNIAKQADLSNTENKVLGQKLKALKSFHKNKDIALVSIIVALGLVALVLAIVLCHQCLKHKKAKYDDENPKEDDRVSLMKDNSSDDGTNISEETEPKKVNVKPDSIETLNEGDIEQGCSRSQTDIEQQVDTSVEDDIEQEVTSTESSDGGSVCSYQNDETGCPAIMKLSNIPATNTEGCNKYAIKRHDVSQSKAST